MGERIVGKVAVVTSDRELIINRGAEDGVQVGTYFAVKGDAVKIEDPDSGELLGEVSPVKVVVRAEEVAPKFCIARTFRSKKVLVKEAEEGNDPLGMSTLASSLAWRTRLQPPRPAEYETRIETLRVDPKKGAPISHAESVVRVGDIVESVLKGEDINPVTTTLFR